MLYASVSQAVYSRPVFLGFVGRQRSVVFFSKTIDNILYKEYTHNTISTKRRTIRMKCKKALKIVGIILGIAAVAAGVYFAITKIKAKKEAANDEENYVSCSCCEAE